MPAILSNLASGQIPYATASGLLTGDANFTRDSVTGALKLLDESGTSGHIYAGYNARKVELTDGTSGSPVTTAGPTLKVTRTGNAGSTVVGSNIVDNEANAAIYGIGIETGASVMQANGVLGAAINSSTDSAPHDAVGLYGIGYKTTNNLGAGTGIFVEGRRDFAASGAGGAELHATNWTTTPGSFNANGNSDVQGVWSTVSGKAHGGVAYGSRGFDVFALMNAGGTGYTTAPVTVSAPDQKGGIQAVATATIVGGVVTAVAFSNPGKGYTVAPTLTIGGDGAGASATAYLSMWDIVLHGNTMSTKRAFIQDDSYSTTSYILNGFHGYGFDSQSGTFTNGIARYGGIINQFTDSAAVLGFTPILRPQASTATQYGILGLLSVDNSTGIGGGASFGITSFANAYYGRVDTTANYAGTIANSAAFHAANTSLGGGAITNEYGFYCDDLTHGATSVAGYFSNVSSGSGKAGFYAAGTALNLFNGPVYIQAGLTGNAGTTTGIGVTPSITPGAGSPADGIALGAISVATGTTSFATHNATRVKASTKSGTGVITNAVGLQLDAQTIGTNNFSLIATGAARFDGNIGFFTGAPAAKQTVSGAKGSNAALASVIAALVAYGMITDTTTA